MRTAAYAATAAIVIAAAITMIVIPTIMLAHSLADVTWPA